MRTKHMFLGLAVILGISVLPAIGAEGGNACAVTAAPNPPFVPPPQFTPYTIGDGEHFLYGTPGLWALVFTRWKLGGQTGNKLPYFSVHYDWRQDASPQAPMIVEAKRLDADAPPVRADHVSGTGPSSRGFPAEPPDPTKPGALLTALRIPTAGCWEITAQYTPPRGGVAEKLSYTILVEP